MAHALRYLTFPLVFVSSLLLAAGCGGSSSSGGSLLEPERCDALQLSAGEARPLEEVAVTGIPAHFGELLAAKVRAVGGGKESITLVARLDEADEVLLHAPLHPQGLAEGGDVELELFDEEGRSCEPIEFRVLPLPAASGTTRAMVDAIAALIDLQAVYFETSVEELREIDPEDLPEHLLPLYLAQHALNDPANPDSLEALLAGTAPSLEGAALDVEYFDRLLAQLGVAAAFEESLAALDELVDGEEPPSASSVGTLRQGLGSLSDPTTAFQLHSEMEMAQWARAFQADRGLGQATRGLSTATGVVGLVPFPPVKAGAMVGGAALFTFLKMTEAAANLLPSRFVSLDFELSPASFAEDDPSVGQWNEVRVVATSEGWKLDQAILETLLQLTNVKGGFDEWMNRFAPEGLLSSIGGALRSEAVGKVIGLSADGSGIFSIAPKQTRPIDITEEPWSFAEISFVLEEEGRQGYRLDPSWAGSDEGEIQIGTALGKFGGRHIYTRKKVRVDSLDIRFDPATAAVEAGETVEFHVSVPNAHDPTLSIEAEKGTVVVLPQADGSYVVQYTAPASEEELPDTITATSESTSGLLENPGRRRPYGIAAIRGKNPYIEISPVGVCVKSGTSQAFTAKVFNLEGQAVQWEASEGVITSAGVFTAPSESGVATITATSTEDAAVSASIPVAYGSCTCTWSVSVSGGTLNAFGGDTFSVMTEESRLTALIFSMPYDESIAPAGVAGELEDGPMLGFAGSGPFSMQGSYFLPTSSDADVFSTIEPALLSLERFELVEGKLYIKGTVAGTIYWERLRGEGPEEEKDWPGMATMSFEGTLEPASPYTPEIYICNPFE